VPVVLHNEKVTARLGRSLADTGLLPDKSMATALAALARYAEVIRLRGITRVETVATAASRDAGNGPEFLAKVAELGLAPRLLTGEEEALAAAHGVIGAFPGAKGVVADLGGGSLELTDIADGAADHGISLPLGTLQLAALRAAGPAKFARKVKRHLARAKLGNVPGQPLYLVGGSSRSLARHATQRLDWPLDDPHGLTLAPEVALRLFRSAAQGKFGKATAGISQSRLAAMPDAAALLGAVIRALEPSEVVFSGWGLREGLLFHSLSAKQRAEDPLIAAVADWVAPHGITTDLAGQVSAWIAPAAGDGTDRLRLAATMLALALWQIEPNLRCDLALDWALRKRWIGIDAADRALLAMAALASTGETTPSARLTRLASEAALHEATAWGLALRLCRKLTTYAWPALADSALTRTDDCLTLAVHGTSALLVTDAVEKELRNTAGWLGLDHVVRRAAV